MRSAPSRREKWKGRVVKANALSHGTRMFLVHTLSKHMKADGFVSHPRWKLASDAGISERQVTRYITNAVNTGWLVTLQPGYRSMTAEYQATFPNPQSGTQDVSLSEPEKGDANRPSLGVTNTSRFPAQKGDVGRPTTSSSTTRPCVVASGRKRNVPRSPTTSSMRLGFGFINQTELSHLTPATPTKARRPAPKCKTVAVRRRSRNHPPPPATRFVCLNTRPRRKAQR